MTEATVEALLVDVLRENQKLCGVTSPVISGATVPIGGLQSFDSLTAVEVVVLLGAKIEAVLGREVDLCVSVFYTDQGRSKMNKGATCKSQSVSEIAKNIYINI